MWTGDHPGANGAAGATSRISEVVIRPVICEELLDVAYYIYHSRRSVMRDLVSFGAFVGFVANRCGALGNGLHGDKSAWCKLWDIDRVAYTAWLEEAT